MANPFGMMSPSFLDMINPEMIDNTTPPDNNSNNNDILTNITQKILEKLNTPDENVTRLTQLLSDMPQREKPSLMRRIGAGITGVGYGPKAAQEFLDKPYNQKIEDWGKKVGIAKTIADEDIKNQRDELAAGARAVTTEIQRKKEQDIYNTKQKQLEQNLFVAQAKLDFASQQLAQKKETDEARQKSFDDYRAALSEHQKATEAYQNAQLERQRAESEARINKLNAEIDKLQNPQSKNQTPAAERTAFANKVQQMSIEHPEWKKYITRDIGGNYTIANVGDKNGPDDVTMSNIRKYLGLGGRDINLPSDSTKKKQKTRQDAIDALKARGKAITESSIKVLLDNPGGW